MNNDLFFFDGPLFDIPVHLGKLTFLFKLITEEISVSQDIIYTMKGVSKVFPPTRYVLKNIYLSYFYGAKIGVLGLNGSGKSTLLKIMAGVDKDFLGEAFPSRVMKVGYLE